MPPPPAPAAAPAGAPTYPPFSIPTLRRAITVLTLTRRLASAPYIAVVALTGGHSWGRANMRARLLPPRPPADAPAASAAPADAPANACTPAAVDAVRVAPWAAHAAVEALTADGGGPRSAAAWARFAHLFAGGAVALVHGTSGEAVVALLKRSREHLRGGVLLGGMVGDQVVGAAVWERLIDGPSELESRTELLSLLARPPQLPRVLSSHSASLAAALAASTRSLPGVLRAHGDALSAGDSAPPVGDGAAQAAASST